jgi:hypothetical protein
LLRNCQAALRAGSDFPTIWTTILKSHRLVLGVPVQRLAGRRTLLEIRLVTGKRLVFDSTSKTFSLE